MFIRNARARCVANSLLSLFIAGFTTSAYAQCVSLTTIGSAATERFDTLSNVAASTTNNLTITGWFLTESGGGARDNEQYAVDTGASNTGDTFSYGSAASTDRALGGLRSGALIPIIGACFTNNTGTAVNALDLAYTGEQWRLGTAARTDQLDFQYSLDATDLVTGTWTNDNALDFIAPVTATTGAKDGNAAANRTALSSTIPALNIANGASFWVRWTDLNASGADDGLAVDDFSVTPQGVLPPPNLTINDVTVGEGNVGTGTLNFVVTLSAPAPAGGVTFDIATADGSATAGSDYVAQSLTGQTIAAGNNTFAFNVTGNGDTLFESDETFFVNVSSVVGAVVTDGQGLGTFLNDDASPSVSLGSPSLAEGNVGTSVANVGVTLSAVAGTDITVAVSTADGTATLGDNDYLAASSNVLIPAGSLSGNFPVTINGDTVVEADETIMVSGLVMRQSGAPDRMPPSNGTITLLNDDTASELSLNLTAAPDPVFPGGTLTYTLNGNNAGPDPAVAAQVAINFTTEFASLSAPGWTCTTPAVGFGGAINCTLASLPLGAFQFTLVTTVPTSALPGQTLDIDAAISSASNDAIPANNLTGTMTTVAALPSIPAVAIPVLGGALSWLLIGLLLVLAGVAMPRRQR